MARSQSSGSSSRASSWWVPLATIAAVTVGALVLDVGHPGGASATAHPALPERSAEQLLSAVAAAAPMAFSGRVSESARWGLPSLPGADTAASLSWQSLLTGSHTLTVAADGPLRQRVGVLGTLTEADVIRNGQQVWTYTSRSNQVTHSTLAPERAESSASVDATALTPQAAAQRFLAAVGPTTNVAVDATRTVAGQSAYTLVLTPKDHRSTLREVSVAIDARHWIALQVKVYGAGGTPVFETGFQSISFTAPAASTFTFTPPAGGRISSNPFGQPGRNADRSASDPNTPGADPAQTTKVLGSGWTSIVAVLPSAGPAIGRSDSTARHPMLPTVGALTDLTSPLGSTGDRVLHTRALNALITRDGRLFLGAVPVAMLQDAAVKNP